MRRYYQFLFSYVIKFLIFSIRPSFHPAILLSCSEIQGEWHIQESFLTGEDCELIFALPLSPRSERIFQSLAGLICRASSSISSNGPEFISYSFVRRKYILFFPPMVLYLREKIFMYCWMWSSLYSLTRKISKSSWLRLLPLFCRILCARNIPPNGNMMRSIPFSWYLLDIIELLTDCWRGIMEMILAFPRRIAYR